MKERKEILIPCFTTIVIAIAVMLLMLKYQPLLIEMAEQNSMLFSFAPTWIDSVIQGDLFYRFMWFIGDLTEGAFYKNVVASIFMLVFALVAMQREKKQSKYAGTGVGGNSEIFLWIVAAQFLGLIWCQLIYGAYFAASGWIPTLVAMCSVAPPLMLIYGKGWSNVITAALLAAVVPFPIAYFIMVDITNPLGLPGFVAVALGMSISTLLTTELCRILPWMKPKMAPIVDSTCDANMVDSLAQAPISGMQLFFRRLFADSSELIFWGSSLAGVGMYLGGMLSWVLNPLHSNYGSGLFPVMLCIQFCTVAVSFFIWYPRYQKNGFCFTFAALIFTSAVVNTYPSHWQVLVPTVVVGSLVVPFAVEWLLQHVPILNRWHPSVTVQLTGAVSCALWSFVVMYAILPFI